MERNPNNQAREAPKKTFQEMLQAEKNRVAKRVARQKTPRRMSAKTFREMLEDEKTRQQRTSSQGRHRNDEEHRIQERCVKWFNATYPQYVGRLFAVPNGGRRDKRTAAKLKSEGVVAGVADMVMLISNRYYATLLIEMKTRTGRQSQSQKEWQKKVEGDSKYVVCRSLDDFKAEVTQYLADI